MIFAQILPGIDAGSLQLMGGVGIITTINAFLRLRIARAGRSRESAVASFCLLALTNAFIVTVADRLLRRGEGSLPGVSAALFFMLLLTLIVTLYDRWRPVFDVRFDAGPRAGAAC